ncbi:MAG: DUF58 domain-containing protein, partial [Clostridia bacterium]|nr:DUF58 domain-containing protein [Clostridia bacterium]
MKRKEREVRLRRIPVAPCRGFSVYILILTACVTFAQAYRSSLSAVVLTLALLLPPADLLCLAVSWFFVSVETAGKDRVISRGEKLSVPIRVVNRGLIPVSAAEIHMSVPDTDRHRARRAVRRISLPPFAGSTTDAGLPFDSRGLYTVGVEELFLFDFLRLIRVRKRVGRRLSVRVLPNRRAPAPWLLPALRGGAGEEALREGDFSGGYSDVREYRPGDGMKAVHWKLSAKTEELQVKKGVAEPQNRTLLLMDLSMPSEPCDLDALSLTALGDAVVEETLSAACDAAEHGMAGRLLWFDGEGRECSASFSDPASAAALAIPLSEVTDGKADPSRVLISEDESATLYVISLLSP